MDTLWKKIEELSDQQVQYLLGDNYDTFMKEIERRSDEAGNEEALHRLVEHAWTKYGPSLEKILDLQIQDDIDHYEKCLQRYRGFNAVTETIYIVYKLLVLHGKRGWK